MYKALVIISLISYSLIILMGQIIGLPFILWLLYRSFDFGNPDQIFAILGIIGISLIFTSYFKKRIIKIICFLLLLTPIIRRITEIPVEKFNYLAFQIPLLIFVLSFLAIIIKNDVAEIRRN